MRYDARVGANAEGLMLYQVHMTFQITLILRHSELTFGLPFIFDEHGPQSVCACAGNRNYWEKAKNLTFSSFDE